MHEIISLFEALGRILFFVMGDFRKAFPKVWREDLRLILKSTVQVTRGGSFVLLFEPNVVHAWLGGQSKLRVRPGILEGGCLGTLLYSLVPNSLVAFLGWCTVLVGAFVFPRYVRVTRGVAQGLPSCRLCRC